MHNLAAHLLQPWPSLLEAVLLLLVEAWLLLIAGLLLLVARLLGVPWLVAGLAVCLWLVVCRLCGPML